LKKKPVFICMLMAILFAMFCSAGWAEVDWNLKRILKLNDPPRDVVVSSKGQWIYVLSGDKTILIYSPDGRLREKIELKNSVDQIKAGPREDLLLLMSKENKTVELLSIDFVKVIDVSGSPFQGMEQAPVVIAVFSEFQ
jgi:hypothetical protein